MPLLLRPNPLAGRALAWRSSNRAPAAPAAARSLTPLAAVRHLFRDHSTDPHNDDGSHHGPHRQHHHARHRHPNHRRAAQLSSDWPTLFLAGKLALWSGLCYYPYDTLPRTLQEEGLKLVAYGRTSFTCWYVADGYVDFEALPRRAFPRRPPQPQPPLPPHEQQPGRSVGGSEGETPDGAGASARSGASPRSEADPGRGGGNGSGSTLGGSGGGGASPPSAGPGPPHHGHGAYSPLHGEARKQPQWPQGPPHPHQQQQSVQQPGISQGLKPGRSGSGSVGLAGSMAGSRQHTDDTLHAHDSSLTPGLTPGGHGQDHSGGGSGGGGAGYTFRDGHLHLHRQQQQPPLHLHREAHRTTAGGAPSGVQRPPPPPGASGSSGGGGGGVGGGGGLAAASAAGAAAQQQPDPTAAVTPGTRCRFIFLRGVQWAAPDTNTLSLSASLAAFWPSPLLPPEAAAAAGGAAEGGAAAAAAAAAAGSSAAGGSHFPSSSSSSSAAAAAASPEHLVAHSGVAAMARELLPVLLPHIRDAAAAGADHVVFAGHSLGGSLAKLLWAMSILQGHRSPDATSCHTFGSPPVLAHAGGGGGGRVLRLLRAPPSAAVNWVLEHDPVPRAMLMADPYFAAARRAVPGLGALLALRGAVLGEGAALSSGRFLYETVGELLLLRWSARGGCEAVPVSEPEAETALQMAMDEAVAAPVRSLQYWLDHHHASYHHDLETAALVAFRRQARSQQHQHQHQQLLQRVEAEAEAEKQPPTGSDPR